ncbi:Zn-dependent hydrolase [Sapientia aquatica]|uniref:Zn-dependent hydrolase n=1 Tax=Sapientia aquatica TaxID=1549640 RepID=A0A4R5VN31_9BURK|nr:Zn-dependent hydrolase [Sapientia aquatica]TDK59649.1 Zn-dependent hydrolase [Sapientia aquatica]
MQQNLDELTINSQRLWNSLMELAKIGATAKGGNCRLALTTQDKEGRDLVVGWMKQAGLNVSVDQIGNIFGRRNGTDNSLPPIMTGSHIDTQPTGGKFDGCYGVLAGLEVIRTMNERNVTTNAPLELAIWTNEEGARFVPVMMGSGVFAGKFTLKTALDARDQQGISVREELHTIGYAGAAAVGDRKIGAYLEAHIEQGPILEHQEKTIGVVTGSLGVRWYDVEVIGMEMHAGPTPMEIRKDALAGATHIIQEVIRIANSFAPHGRGTVGSMQVHPGSRNVIPGKVHFTVDLRHLNEVTLAQMDSELRAVCSKVEQRQSLTVHLKDVQYFPPTQFDSVLVNQVRISTVAAGFSNMDMVTGAGHDAVYMASVTPTAMIFVPCKDGISHNEIEDAKPEHLAAGCQVLFNAMLLSSHNLA